MFANSMFFEIVELDILFEFIGAHIVLSHVVLFLLGFVVLPKELLGLSGVQRLVFVLVADLILVVLQVLVHCISACSVAGQAVVVRILKLR